MANLLETYKQRVAIAEKVYSNTHKGEKLDNFKKIAMAKCLDNTNKFISEAFDNSVGTQRSDLGLFKKFSMNLVNVAVPNLIAFDLVMVYPMSSMSGYVNYLKFTSGSNKGQTKQGDVFNSPFKLGDVNPNFTSDRVVESDKAVMDDTDVVVNLMWTPVMITEDNKLAGGKIIKVSTGTEITDYTVTKEGRIKFNNGVSENDDLKIAYVYDNIVIPQNDLPILNVEMASIPLLAKARRIAIYYSNIAAYQAKQDYGFDMSSQLIEKAVGELNYKFL